MLTYGEADRNHTLGMVNYWLPKIHYYIIFTFSLIFKYKVKKNIKKKLYDFRKEGGKEIKQDSLSPYSSGFCLLPSSHLQVFC